MNSKEGLQNVALRIHGVVSHPDLKHEIAQIPKENRSGWVWQSENGGTAMLLASRPKDLTRQYTIVDETVARFSKFDGTEKIINISPHPFGEGLMVDIKFNDKTYRLLVGDQEIQFLYSDPFSHQTSVELEVIAAVEAYLQELWNIFLFQLLLDISVPIMSLS